MDRREGEELIRKLYRAHADRVLGYALRRGASRPDAEDVVIETFLTCWRRLGEAKDPGLPWLFGIARRVLSNQRRAIGRRETLEKRILEGDPLTPLGEPDPGNDHELLRALSRLEEDEREALLLTAWDGLSQTEAAKMLGCSRTTFAVRLKGARADLCQLLERESTQIAAIRTEEGVGEDSGDGILMDTP
jgi:RNA polymerase sigma-70 factor (ECF subfamily)